MKKKVILFSIDGMRPDALKICGNSFVKELEKKCAFTYSAKSMNPSVTLPCHFSMAHSVTPQRHGILTNTYIPQVRPVKGIFELISENRGINAFFYGWEQLRDIALPDTLKFATYINFNMYKSCDTVLTNECIKELEILSNKLNISIKINCKEKEIFIKLIKIQKIDLFFLQRYDII